MRARRTNRARRCASPFRRRPCGSRARARGPRGATSTARREHDALDVAADALELLDALPVRDARDVLLDDRPGVELLGDVVRRRADDLHAALARAAVRIGADERRQERVVDVDHRHAEPVEEVRARGSACSARARRGRPCRRAARASAPRPRPSRRASTGTWWYGTPKPRDVGRVVGVVRDDGDDVGVELAAAPAPEQVEQAVVVARREERRPLARGLRRRSATPSSNGSATRSANARSSSSRRSQQPLEPELHAHEERAALGVGRVLVGAEDVRVAAPRGSPRPRRRCRAGRGTTRAGARCVDLPPRSTRQPSLWCVVDLNGSVVFAGRRRRVGSTSRGSRAGRRTSRGE